MIFIYLIISLLSPINNNQVELNKVKLLEDNFFQNEKNTKNKKNKKKLGCKLAIEYQNINEFRKSSKYLKYCKKLGYKYKELYTFLDIRKRFYLNEKGLVYKINYFLRKYENSSFTDEINKIKLRYYFKNGKYKSAYYGYLKYKKENNPSHEDLIFINYILRYSYLKIAKKNDKFIALLDVLQDKQFYLKEVLESYKEQINKYPLSDIKKMINLYLKEKKYYKISKLLYLTRIYATNLFEYIANNKEIKELLNNKQTNLNYQINIYHFNKKNWDFNKREDFLNNLLNLSENEQEKKDILYQKLLLYKKYKKLPKRIETYKKMLELRQPRRKQSYYYLKIGVYSLELGNEKEGIKYLNLLIKKFNRWYKEYPSALFVLFNLYRNKYLNNKNNHATAVTDVPPKKNNISKKDEDFIVLQEIEKKMEKTYLKQISYFYKYKDNRMTKKEKKKIEEYFKLRPYNFYSIMINKKTIDKLDAWKLWENLTKYQEIPNFSKKIEKKSSKKYLIYKISKIFKKYDKLFTEINLIRNLQYIEEDNLQEKLMINFYNRLYKLNKIKNKKNIDEDKKPLVDALKEIKKNYYYYFLNYFIAINNIQYAYLLMHRHFRYLKNDDFYKFYYSPIPYTKIIDKEAKFFNINPLIIVSIMETESIFNPNAYSSAGAIGLMQIMPATGRGIAKELKVENYDLYLPKFNIKFGAYYLSELLKRFHYQLPFAATSYNGGPHNMRRWLQSNKSKKLKLDEMIEKIGFRESRNYAKKIIRLFSTYRKLYFNQETTIPINVNFDDEKKIDF